VRYYHIFQNCAVYFDYLYKYLIVKLEGKRLLANPRSRWEVRVERDLEGIGCVDIVANRPVAKRPLLGNDLKIHPTIEQRGYATRF
jgi:hypothetical protein